ncbi:hypothetical protein KI387_010761, partial [Taxus chinensis]
VHVGTLLEEDDDPIKATQSAMREEESVLTPKEEEYIRAMEENHIVLEALSVKYATEEPSVLPHTSSPSRSNFEEEFDISNFIFENEDNHGDQVADQENTMEEVEHLLQDNNEI